MRESRAFLALVTVAIVGFAAGCERAPESERLEEDPADTLESAADTTTRGNRVDPSAEGVSEENPYVVLPAIDAWYEGRKIWFVHTEVSQEEMARRLTEMVDYPSVHAERLGEIDTAKAGPIYVFRNGVDRRGAAPWGGGPFHRQIDVFAVVPGDSGYTPLHNPRLVSWRDTTAARVLRSEAEVLEAERDGEVTIERTPVIVNAPIVRWPGGPTGVPPAKGPP